MTPTEELYMLGFIDKCAELGVDPAELMKQAGVPMSAVLALYTLLKGVQKVKEPTAQGKAEKSPAGKETPVEEEQEQPAPEKESAVSEDYVQGFIDKCAELGVDPTEVFKLASKLRQPVHKGVTPNAGPAPAPPAVTQPNTGLMPRLLAGRGAGGLGPGLRSFGRLGLRGGLTSAT